MDILQVWKRVGETPLECLQRASGEYGIDKKGCYTGRLDPMAQGAMTLLFGDQVHQSPLFNGSSKIYRFQAVLGISTTSYDPLGRVTHVRQVSADEAEAFTTRLLQLGGDITQVLPPCSAYRYKGKPLWMHAQNGTLPSPLPTKQVQIYTIRKLQPHPTSISLDQYRQQVFEDIAELTPADGFDVSGVKDDWTELPAKHVLYRICIEAHVGSGTFVRSLVYDTARDLGIPAHAFRITRMRGDTPKPPLNEGGHPQTPAQRGLNLVVEKLIFEHLPPQGNLTGHIMQSSVSSVFSVSSVPSVPSVPSVSSVSSASSASFDLTQGLFTFEKCVGEGDCVIFYGCTLKHQLQDDLPEGQRIPQISLVPDNASMKYYLETLDGDEIYQISGYSVRMITGRTGFVTAA